MKKWLACLIAAVFMFGAVSFAETHGESTIVEEAVALIEAATADERQEIFGELVWHMIFVDGAEAVDSAFAAVGKFLDGDDSAAPVARSHELAVGDTIEADGQYVIGVLGSDIAAELLPANTDGAYSYYEADEGQQYAALRMSFKNLHTEAVCPADMIELTLIYDGSYVYDGFCVVEDGNDFQMYGEITPLSTKTVVLAFEVPDEVADSDGSLTVAFTLNGTDYSFIVR